MNNKLSGNPPTKESIFEIDDLECGYNNRGKVLQVSHLEIKKGEFIVILGNSGSGKTTLLETLGLMANTIQNGTIKFFPINSSPIAYSQLWEKNRRYELTNIRKEHLNFIFQDNNLMPNLSNRENVVLADLINDYRTLDAADKEASLTLDSVNLPFSTHIRFPQHISGGERQRVAFARGIQPKFSVLFGDEPTGNLDEKNATELMEKVRLRMKSGDPKTAIIVSHNIELSLQHADRIIILTKSAKGDFYEILEEKIIVKKNGVWCKMEGDLKPEPIEKPKKYIEDILESNISKNHNTQELKTEGEIEKIDLLLCNLSLLINSFKTKYLKRDSKINPAFLKLFLSRENDELTGRKNYSFWIFVLAVTVTLLIIAWTNRSMINLEKSMKDPFVNSLDIIHNNEGMIEPVRNLLDAMMNETDSVTKYDLHKISYFNGVDLTFLNLAETDVMGFRGRTIDYDDPVLNKILDPKINNAVGRKFQSSEDEGIIVTRNLLSTINADENSPFIILRKERDGIVYKTPVTIIAVVDHLPGTSSANDFLITPKFFDSYISIDGNYPFDVSEKLRILCFLSEEEMAIFNKTISESLTKLTNDRFENIQSNYEKLQSGDSIAAVIDLSSTNFAKKLLSNGNSNKEILRNLYSIEIITTPGLVSIEEADALYDKLMKMNVVSDFFKNKSDLKQFVQQSYFSRLTSEESLNMRSGISFLFKETKRINEFAEMFRLATQPLDPNQKGMLLDMSKVNSMYTFFTVSNLTNIILFILIFFSVFAILLYIYQQLNMHLYKIRRNIGTLMACGMNTRAAYRLLVFTYVLVCYFFPLSVVFIAQFIFPRFITLTASSRALFFTGLTTFFVFFGLFIVFVIANKKYFDKTPSDLIYSRTN